MSLIDYHKSISHEVLAVANRVKNLIEHWPEIGRQNEAVIKNVIRKFLPDAYSIATGFVVKQTEKRGEHLSSKQIDLIIYDSISPVLFKEGDFVILTQDAVRGIIEVKSNLQKAGLTETVRQANENGEFIYFGKDDNYPGFFNGIFSFGGFSQPVNPQTIANNITTANHPFRNIAGYQEFKVNHISFNENWFLKYWSHQEEFHSLYELKDLSFAFFIANLVDMVANRSVRKNDFIWFANDKEVNLKHTFL